VHFIGLAQLMDADGGGDIGEIVFKAGRSDLVVPGAIGGVSFPCVARDAVQGHEPHAVGMFVGLSAGHSALAGGDGFVGVERVAANLGGTADGQPGLVFIFAIPRGATVSRVFDDFEMKFLGEAADASDVADLAAVMDGDDGDNFMSVSASVLDFSACIEDIEVEIGGATVGQQRNGVEIADDFGGGGKGHRGDDDILAGL